MWELAYFYITITNLFANWTIYLIAQQSIKHTMEIHFTYHGIYSGKDNLLFFLSFKVLLPTKINRKILRLNTHKTLTYAVITAHLFAMHHVLRWSVCKESHTGITFTLFNGTVENIWCGDVYTQTTSTTAALESETQQKLELITDHRITHSKTNISGPPTTDIFHYHISPTQWQLHP
jgi:hypothetical protein